MTPRERRQTPLHLIKGRRAERRALRFLLSHGLRRVESNFRCRFGEIDLIMRDADYLVFVEVRYRRGEHYGGAIGSINLRKQRKLQATAAYYLQTRCDPDRQPCRFDVITFGDAGSDNGIQWVKNAF